MSKTNIPLLIFDILILPIQIIRLVIIYFYSAKYNLPGFKFLDVIMHADNKYFNKDNEHYINTECIDYRCIVRDDSRLCPMDVKKYLVIHNKQITDSMATSEDDYQSDTEKPIVGINTSTHTILDSIKNELKDYIFY